MHGAGQVGGSNIGAGPQSFGQRSPTQATPPLGAGIAARGQSRLTNQSEMGAHNSNIPAPSRTGTSPGGVPEA